MPEYEQLLCERHVDFVIAYDGYTSSRHTNELAVLRRLAAAKAPRVRLRTIEQGKTQRVYAVDRRRCG